MTIKTFNANRVGGGTFELEQDATTGEYKLKEVGFIKLPELKLPEIDQADPIIPDPADPDPDPDPDPSDPGTGGGGSGGGGDNQQLDYTGTRFREDIQKQATGDTNLTEQAKQFSASDIAYQNYKQVQQNYKNAIDQDAPSPELRQLSLDLDRARANVGMVTTGNQRFGATGDEGFVGPDKTGFGTQEVNEDLIDRGNPTGDSRIVSEEQGLTGDAASKFAQARQSMTMPVDYNLPGARSPVPYSNLDPYQQSFLDKAPGFETRVSMLPDVAAPVKTAATQFGVPDAVRFGQPSLPDPISKPKQNILKTAENFINNNTTIKAMGGFMETGAKIAIGIGDAILGVTPAEKRRREADSSAAKSLGYTTVGELGGSTDPGRIASVRLADGTIATSSADSVFVGFNRDSAKGNLSGAAAKRIETRNSKKTQDRLISKYGSANHPKVVEFNNKTKSFQNELNDFNNKKKEQPVTGTTKPGESGGAQDKGGKSIVCTAMYQTTGLQDWAKAMKIWYIYQKKYLTIQHQEGYHKLFKPFVKGMHKNNIIKAIGAHFAKHRTQHLKHVMFNSKPSLLGKIYNKILEPICYWAGRK